MSGIVLLVGAVIMIFEILASRIIAPYFGSSVYTWGNLIGVILGAMTAGYGLGGRWASTAKGHSLPALLLGGAGLLLCALPWSTHFLCSFALSLEMPTLMTVFLALVLLCGPPTVLMAAFFPLAAQLISGTETRFGKLTGKLGMISTAGSLLGTFVCTFILVNLEFLGTRRSLLLCGVCLVACSLRLKVSRSGIVVAVLALGLVWAGRDRLMPPLFPGEMLVEERDTPYHSIRIFERSEKGELQRVMSFGDSLGEQTSVSVRAGLPSVNLYTELFHFSRAFSGAWKKVLVLGAGGGVIPRDLLKEFPEIRVDVVDIDGVVFELAEKYFAYPKDVRLRSFVEDARAFLRRGEGEYDLVFVDVYSNGSQIPEHLSSREFFQEVESVLAPNGRIVVNLLLPRGPSSKTSPRYLSFLKTLSLGGREVQAFSTARLYPQWLNEPFLNRGGVIFVAGRRLGEPDFSRLRPEIQMFSHAHHIPLWPEQEQAQWASAPVLTDDFNPLNLLR